MWAVIGLVIYAIVCLLVAFSGNRRYAIPRLLIAVMVPTALYMARIPIGQWIYGGAQIVTEVNSGNVLTVRLATGNPQQLVLAGTELPASVERQQRATATLDEQLNGKTVILELMDIRFSGPSPAVVWLNGVNINQLMVSSGLLMDTAKPPSPNPIVPVVPGTETTNVTGEKEAGPSPGVATDSGITQANEVASEESEQWLPWQRYLLWFFIGFVGSTGLGMILADNKQGWLAFLGVLVGIGWSIYTSWSDNISIWPPIVGLAIMLVFAGNGAKAHRLMHPPK